MCVCACVCGRARVCIPFEASVSPLLGKERENLPPTRAVLARLRVGEVEPPPTAPGLRPVCALSPNASLSQPFALFEVSRSHQGCGAGTAAQARTRLRRPAVRRDGWRGRARPLRRRPDGRCSRARRQMFARTRFAADDSAHAGVDSRRRELDTRYRPRAGPESRLPNPYVIGEGGVQRPRLAFGLS